MHTAAFADPHGGPTAEATLVDQLRDDPGWLPRLSLVAVAGDGTVIGHVLCTCGHLDQEPVLALGPIGVLPSWQRRGVGTALMHAVLGAADARDEPLVVLLGDETYYRRFGFVPASALDITPPVAQWAGPHFQARPLAAYQPQLRGTFHYPEPFLRL